MKKFEVQYVHIIERTVTCLVKANSKEEAIEKAKNGDYECDDEDECPEQGIETKDYIALELE